MGVVLISYKNIRDFTDGIDRLGITNGLTFADLTIIQDDIGSSIALVKDINASVITENDFFSV